MSLHPQTLRIQHQLAQWSKQGRRHWDLYRWLMNPYVLMDALKLVMKNGGAPGIDGERIEDIRKREWAYVTGLARQLRERRYHPLPVRRQYIPKADGKLRPLGIPRTRDRVVQRALVLLMEPIYETIFMKCSYGFRPEKSAPECAYEAAKAIWSKRYVLEADIEGFFDHVQHDKLMGMLEGQIVDPRVLRLIGAMLKVGFIEPGKPWEATVEGTPQGGPLSPLLANIYLHYALDVKFHEKADKKEHTKLFRYCDDFIIVTDRIGRLRNVRKHLEEWMKAAGLRLKESKTREIDMSSEKRSRESHFDFLGYRIHLRAFTDNPRRFWVARQPSEKARVRLRANIREKLRPNLNLEQANQVLLEVWQGWCGYFRYGNANRVFYRECHSVEKQIFGYLRRKYRQQRRPVKWATLRPLAKVVMKDVRPLRVISDSPRQCETLRFA